MCPSAAGKPSPSFITNIRQLPFLASAKQFGKFVCPVLTVSVNMYCTCLQGAQTEKPLYGSCSEPINLSVLLFSLTYQTWVACPEIRSTSPPSPSTNPEAMEALSLSLSYMCVRLTQNLSSQNYMGPGENRGLPLSRCPISILKFPNPWIPEPVLSKYPTQHIIV